MNIYQISCSDSSFLNDVLAEEKKTGWEPISLSCNKGGSSYPQEDVSCCILFKKQVVGTEYLPDAPTAKVWKRKR